jgi:hypothetical protein
VLRLARGLPLLHRGLAPVKNRLFWERRLGRKEVGALQLQRLEGVRVSRGRQAPRRSTSRQKQIRYIEKMTTYNFFCPRVGEHREQPRRRPRVGLSPDRLHHAALDLERQRERRHGHGPLRGGLVSRHLAKAKRPPPERHDSSAVIFPDHFRRGDSGSSETPQHGPVVLEDFLLLFLGGAIRPAPSRPRDGVPGARRERELGVVLHVEPPLVPATVRAGQRRRSSPRGSHPSSR